MGTTANASRADIIGLLRDGHSNARIARELHVDKHRVRHIREELGLPRFVPVEQTRTLEEKWARFTKPVEGGHVEWTGTRGSSSGTPVLSYKENLYTAASIAFKIKTGCEPHGYVRPDCGFKHCVAPAHVNDEAGRQATRQETRQAAGWGDRPETCPHGHDQSEHGRFESDGTSYCEACKRGWRRDPAGMKAKTATRRAEKRRAIETLLRDGVPHTSIARQVGAAVETIQRVRHELGLPPARSGRRDTYTSREHAFHANTEPADGGHLRWTGYTHPKTGSQYVCFRQERATASKVAFALHHGREPVGRVFPNCDMDGCVAGAHLADRPMREANRRADAAFNAIFGEAL